MSKHEGSVQISLDRYLELHGREKVALGTIMALKQHIDVIYGYLIKSLADPGRLVLQPGWSINIDSMDLSRKCTSILIMNNVLNFQYD